jgi:hypothetical protein
MALPGMQQGAGGRMNGSRVSTVGRSSVPQKSGGLTAGTKAAKSYKRVLRKPKAAPRKAY